MEIVKHVLSINSDGSLSRSKSHQGRGSLAFSKAPCASGFVNLCLSFLSRKCSSEIVEINSVKLREVFQHPVICLRVREISKRIIQIIHKLSLSVSQIVLEVRVLFVRVE